MTAHTTPKVSAPACAVALVVMALAAATGFVLSTTSPELPGTESLTLEDAVDTVAILLFGVLGAVLIVRRRAALLGAALMLMAGMIGVDYLLGGLADFVADGLPIRRLDPADKARHRRHDGVGGRAGDGADNALSGVQAPLEVAH